MSLTKSATRRLSLMAGSSLVAAGIAGAAALMPSPAAAQVNACGDPSLNAAAADTFQCASPPTYATGVDYSATTNGDLTLILRNRFDTGTAGTGGIRLFGKTGEDMTLIRQDNPLGAGDPRVVNTAGRAVHLTTQGDGNVLIDLTDGDPASGESTSSSSGTAPIRITGSTDAVRAEALGTGNVSVIFAPTTPAGSSAVLTAGANVAGGSGIYARTTSGDINIDARAASFSINGTNGVAGIDAASSNGGDLNITTGGVTGRLYGVRAQTSGAGAATITTGSVSVSGAASIAALDLTTGTGPLTYNYTGGFSIDGGQSHALRLNAGGDATLNFGALVGGGGANKATVDITTSAGTVVLNHVNILSYSTSNEVDRFVMRGAGAGDIVINSIGEVGLGAQVRGYVDFSAHTGALTWNIGERWATKGVNNVFGAGDHTIVIGAGADWLVGVPSLNAGVTGGGPAAGDLDTTVIDFGGGEDRVVNNGTVMLAPKSVTLSIRYFSQDYLESTTRLEGLETFENAGMILFGGSAVPGAGLPAGESGGQLDLKAGSYAVGPDYAETDYTPDDVLVMPGTHWVGSGASTIILDAFLTENQSACDVALRNTEMRQEDFVTSITGEMPAADCMSLEGGSTDGVTNVLINQLATGDRGGAVRIVLVDVSGGTSDAGHFVLDPRNHGYNPDQGGYIDLGYVIIPLVYDADTQQHVLLGTAGQNAWQTAGWAAAAHEVWRTSAGSWFDRQADLRGDLPDGVGGGIWMRTSADFAQRDVIHAQQAGVSTFLFDNSYEQSTYAVTGGADLLTGGGANTAWVVGLMAGYANAELTYDASPNATQIDSWNGGLYASFLSGGLFVDAAVSGNKADIKADMPTIGLQPVGTLLDTRLLSVGAQLEAGWRLPFAGSAFIEPLAGVSYVQTKWDDLTIASDDPMRQGVDVEFDDPTSLRANVGARLGMDQDYGGFRAQYSILGRVWNEFEGEHILALHNTQEDIMVGDEFTGTMNEVSLGASIYGSVVSGFLNVGGKWADDYESVGGAVGVRVAW